MDCISIRVLEGSKPHSDDFNKKTLTKRLLNNYLSKNKGNKKSYWGTQELETIGSLTSLCLMGQREEIAVTAAQSKMCFGEGAFQQAGATLLPEIWCQRGRKGYPNLFLPSLWYHADASTGQAQREVSEEESAGDAVHSGQIPRHKAVKNQGWSEIGSDYRTTSKG